jgi:hypothetical protein
MSITCVLIENRELSNIREIIFDNHLKFLPKGSNVIFFHSKNYEYIKNNLIGLPIIFINLDEILMNYETNHQVYINKLLLSSSFWDKILQFSEKILMIQPDSKILRSGIEEFIEWDYFGSTWKHSIIGGNGGFSWRNVKIMKKITESFKYDTNWDSVIDDNGDIYKISFTNEDVFFSFHHSIEELMKIKISTLSLSLSLSLNSNICQRLKVNITYSVLFTVKQFIKSIISFSSNQINICM